MDRLIRDFIRYVEQMDTHEWLFAVLAAIALGFVCMRGFGSRSDY